MKRLLILTLSIFCMASCYKRQKNCQAYKTGVFKYHTFSDGKLLESKIVRTDSLEIDYFDPQHPDTAKIRWVNDCAYIARKYHPENRREKQAYLIRIIETTKDSYIFE